MLINIECLKYRKLKSIGDILGFLWRSYRGVVAVTKVVSKKRYFVMPSGRREGDYYGGRDWRRN